MTVLADHNLEGQAILIWGNLGTDGWLDIFPLRLVDLDDYRGAGRIFIP